MRPIVLLVATLVVAGGLAGCLGSPGPSGTETPTEDPARVVEDPDNYTYVDNASFETGGHIHDYWDGHDELTIVDRTERFGQGSLMPTSPDPEQVAVMRPPAGNVIPQGTETVRVTISWEDRNGGQFYRDPQLWVRTADEHGFHRVADVEPGDTVEIASANANNDLPHRRLSGWAFAFYVEPIRPGGALYFQADLTMEVVAERGLELPVFPAHPDHWRGRGEIELFEDTAGTFFWDPDNPLYGSACIGDGCSQIYDGVHRPTNGTIVPPDASLVRVELSPTSDTPTRIDLAYHGADTWQRTRLQPTTTEDGTRVYDIPVRTETADGPYNEQSLWRFVPYISEPVEDGVWAGSYEMSATASRNVPE